MKLEKVKEKFLVSCYYYLRIYCYIVYEVKILNALDSDPVYDIEDF